MAITEQSTCSRRAVSPQAVEARISQVGTALSASLRELLEILPGAPARPMEVSRALGINRDLASKLLAVTDKADPLAAAYMMPGPEALHTVVRAATHRKLDKTVVRKTETAVNDFQDVLRNVVDGRSELNAILSVWLPQARERIEMSNKQAAFKAFCTFKGVRTDVGLNTVMVHPSGDGETCDALSLFGRVNLRRLRPETPIRLNTGHTGPGPPGMSWETLQGDPLDLSRADFLVEDFCSAPLPQIEVHRSGDVVSCLVAGDEIGLESAVDVFLAQVVRRAFKRHFDPEKPRKKSVSAEVEIPTRRLIFDVLLHKEIFPGSAPELMIYDTSIQGVANPNDPAREFDRLDLVETVQDLGRGTLKFRIAEVPNYVELIRHICSKLGWESEEFRGYRCRIEYPVYGSQVHLAFPPPARPHGR